MIYPKFPQRYLAAIVFCLILTLAALGGIFLIYLFNGNSTPLLFTADMNPAIAKPPNYFYGNDDKFSSYQQNLLHKESQLQRESAESHSIKDELVTLDELASATSGSISSEQQLPRSMKQQQKQRVANRRENYHRMISAASGPVIANSDELSLEHQQAMFSQQQKLQHQPQLLQPSSDISDSVEATAKEVSAENDDDVKLVSALTSIEGFQYQIPSSSSENSDTIYIDDFERQSSSGDIRFDETSGNDDVSSDNNNNNMRINNFTDVVVEENDTNSAMTTTSSSAIAVAQNNSNINRFNYKAHSKQRNNKRRQQLTAMVKKKRKQQRLLSKLQHKSSNNNVVKLNPDKHLKHQLLQYSTQKVKKHLNLQHRENRFSAYESNSSVNDVDDMIVNSGSGDFNSDDNNDNDDSDDDYDIDSDTTNYIKRINIKMWRAMSNVADNSNIQRKSKQHQQQLRQIQAFSNKKKKHRRFKHKQALSADNNNIFNKQQNLRNVPNDVDNFYSISSEIVSNLSAPQLNHEQETLIPTVTISQQGKDSLVRKSNISSSSGSNNNRINQISTATAKNTVAITNNNQWSFSPNYNVNNVTSSTSTQINNTSTPQHQQQQQMSSRTTDLAAASEPVAKSAASGGSAAWLETRTRRIMGNVKKSEERSRQLLLCEEAGGGELCRMLFKGHLNE